MKYIMITEIVVENRKLSSTDKLLSGIINSLAYQKGYCYASNEYLSNRLNVSRRTISKSLSKLKKEKVITIEVDNYKRKIYLTSLVWNNTSNGIDELFHTP